MNSKSLGIIFLFLLWGSGSTYWYVCKIKGFCAPKNQPQTATKIDKTTPKIAPKPVQHNLVYFKSGETHPVINDSLQWQAEVKSIKQLQAEGKKLRIEAPYYDGEANPSNFDNLGLARADAIKKILSKSIDSNLILTQGYLLPHSSGKIPAFIEFGKDRLKWIQDNDFVQEKAQKTLIHFPYNSTKAIKNKTIISYLDQVGQKLQQHPDLRLLVIGYTDNIGSAASNKILGMKRANRIKDLLLKKGIEASRIKVKSEGKNQPIVDNNTSEGRKQNRRVEISFIKK